MPGADSRRCHGLIEVSFFFNAHYCHAGGDGGPWRCWRVLDWSRRGKRPAKGNQPSNWRAVEPSAGTTVIRREKPEQRRERRRRWSWKKSEQSQRTLIDIQWNQNVGGRQEGRSQSRAPLFRSRHKALQSFPVRLQVPPLSSSPAPPTSIVPPSSCPSTHRLAHTRRLTAVDMPPISLPGLARRHKRQRGRPICRVGPWVVSHNDELVLALRTGPT